MGEIIAFLSDPATNIALRGITIFCGIVASFFIVVTLAGLHSIKNSKYIEVATGNRQQHLKIETIMNRGAITTFIVCILFFIVLLLLR